MAKKRMAEETYKAKKCIFHGLRLFYLFKIILFFKIILLF